MSLSLPRLPRLPAAVTGLVLSCTLAVGLASPSPAAAAGPEPKELNIYNWSDYIADDTLKNFEKETGIKVNYDTYDSNEILHSKLIAGKTGYDIVVPSAHFAKMQLEAGLFQKLDRSKLPNWSNLDPNLLQLMARVDPGNQYLVDWLWGYITVGVNTGKVKQALGGLAMPDNPWQLVLDPQYADKLKTCGISVLDSPSELMPIALGYVGKPQYSRNAADYAAATAMLKKIRPDISRFSSSGYINDLAAGSLCAVLGYSGDINIARSRAIAAKNGNDIVAFVPKSGATLFFDSMAIPADAPHPQNALLFINYILRPEVAASLTNKVFYANPNKASLKSVRPDIAGNDSIFPKPEEMARMAVPDTLPQDAKRIQTRAFTEFKTGQ